MTTETKLILIILLMPFLFACSKEKTPQPTPTPTPTQVINNYTLTYTVIGGIPAKTKISINNIERTGYSIPVKTGDVLTGYTYYIGSVPTRVGINVSLDAVVKYQRERIISTDTLFYSYTIN